MSPDLDRIVSAVRRRAAERRVKQPLERLRDIVREDSWRRERFLAALSREPFAILPAIRRKTPWAGALLAEPEGRAVNPTRVPAPGPRWFAFAQACQQGGAAALVVATELDHFGGSLEDLRAVEFTGLSRVRDDFIVDEAMLWEACLYGADAVVLRPAIVDDAASIALRAVARELGLAVLVLARDERELDFVLALEPEVLLITTRDAASGSVDLGTIERLAPRIPTGARIGVAGGLATSADLQRARAAGATVALVGEALLSAADARITLAGWKAVLGADG